jgi:hypothetical protein
MWRSTVTVTGRPELAVADTQNGDIPMVLLLSGSTEMA